MGTALHLVANQIQPGELRIFHAVQLACSHLCAALQSNCLDAADACLLLYSTPMDIMACFSFQAETNPIFPLLLTVGFLGVDGISLSALVTLDIS